MGFDRPLRLFLGRILCCTIWQKLGSEANVSWGGVPEKTIDNLVPVVKDGLSLLVRGDNIRLRPVVNQYMHKKVPGHIHHVRFKNIAVEGEHTSGIRFLDETR